MQGVKDKIFIRTDVNGVNQLGPEDKILLRGQVLSGRTPESSPVTDERKDTRMPLAWFRSYKAQSGKTGRAFCTTSGASVDWLSEDLRRLMVNVIFDLTGHTHEIPVETDVDFIMEYQPSAFGSLTDAQWQTATPDDFLPVISSSCQRFVLLHSQFEYLMRLYYRFCSAIASKCCSVKASIPTSFI